MKIKASMIVVALTIGSVYSYFFGLRNWLDYVIVGGIGFLIGWIMAWIEEKRTGG